MFVASPHGGHGHLGCGSATLEGVLLRGRRIGGQGGVWPRWSPVHSWHTSLRGRACVARACLAALAAPPARRELPAGSIWGSPGRFTILAQTSRLGSQSYKKKRFRHWRKLMTAGGGKLKERLAIMEWQREKGVETVGVQRKIKACVTATAQCVP